MCSSSAAALENDMIHEFGVTSLQSRLPVAMFLFRFAVGPVILTPLAEVQIPWSFTGSMTHVQQHRIMVGRKSLLVV